MIIKCLLRQINYVVYLSLMRKVISTFRISRCQLIGNCHRFTLQLVREIVKLQYTFFTNLAA